jgi:Spy/CpxP family protein refolding chaperone
MRRLFLAGFIATILGGLTLAGTSAASSHVKGEGPGVEGEGPGAHEGPGRHEGPGAPGGPGGHEAGRLIDEHADELSLDEETREAIQQIVDDSRKEARGFHWELRGQHEAMRDLLSQDEPDEAAVMQQAESIGKLETEMHKHRLSTLLAVRALLTPEQRTQLTRIRREMRREDRDRGGRRRGTGPPRGYGGGER